MPVKWVLSAHGCMCVHVVTPSPWGVHSHSHVTLHLVRAVLTLVSVTLADQVTRAGAVR